MSEAPECLTGFRDWIERERPDLSDAEVYKIGTFIDEFIEKNPKCAPD